MTRVYDFFIISFVICTIFEFFVIPFAMLKNILSPKIFRKLVISPNYYRETLASSIILRWSIFLQCTWSMTWLFNLFPVLVFLKKVSMCCIEKRIALALFAVITKSNFTNGSTASKITLDFNFLSS